MKKIATILICLLCFGLTACEPIWFEYEYEVLENDVVSVELISYNNPYAKTQMDNWGNLKYPDFDFNEMLVIGTMKEENLDPLFQDISSTMVGNFIRQIDSPNGLCLKINYQDNTFDIISDDFIGRYNHEGKIIQYLGVFDGGRFRDIKETHIEHKTDLYE
jgi:hypothetical protein